MTFMKNDDQEPMKPFGAYQSMLRERLQLFLDPLSAELREDVIHALQETGKLFAQTRASEKRSMPAGSWALLTLLTALHIAPDINPICANSIAVSIECFICALDLLDDVEDEDQTPILKELGTARVLNVSTTLLTLAQRIILSISSPEFPASYILRLLDAMQESLLVATTGQQRDLLAEQKSAQQMTAEECIEIATEKAGALMRLACRIGVLSAGGDDEICEQFSFLGQLLGVAHQLDNDCHDLYYLLQDQITVTSMNKDVPILKHVKTDLVRSKKTLPIVLAAQSGWNPHSSDEEKRTINQRLLQEGIMATWGTCLLYRERARDQLQKIETRQPVSHALRLLLGFV